MRCEASESRIPFLPLRIQRNEGNSLKLEVYPASPDIRFLHNRMLLASLLMCPLSRNNQQALLSLRLKYVES